MAICTLKGIMTGIVSGRYPNEPMAVPEGYRGRPELHEERCAGDTCWRCVEVCLPKALTWTVESKIPELRLDYGRCVFCGLCEEACPEQAITLTRDVELAARSKTDLTVKLRVLGNGHPSPGDSDSDLGGRNRNNTSGRDHSCVRSVAPYPPRRCRLL